MTISLENLFFDRMQEVENGCWEPTTYGVSVMVGGKHTSYYSMALNLFFGWVDKENIPYRPIRVCNNGRCFNPTHLLVDFSDRFLYYCEIESSDGCWNWVGAVDGGGYGCLMNGKYGREKAHRISYMEYVGEIPAGMYVCHKCDNPACINPRHLFLGTHYDNIQDKVSKNRQHNPKGTLNGRAKLSDQEVENLRSDYASGQHSYRTLSKKYGLGYTQVARILKRESWSWLP